MLPRARLGLITAVLSLLAACGGDGGSGSPTTPPPVGNPPPQAPTPPPTAPTAEDLANARASQMKVTLRPDTKYLTISWTDTFASETGYRVESRLPDGTWQTLASTPSGNATGGPFEVSRTIDVPMAYRVSAVMAGYTVPLQTPQGLSEVPFESETKFPRGISAPPVNWLPGTFQLRVSSWGGHDLVSYYLGNDAIGSTTEYPLFPVNWDTTTVPNGTYTVTADVRMNTGAFVELSGEMVVDNPNLAASLHVVPIAGSLTDYAMNARATSAAGIRSVDFFVDNARVESLPGTAESDYSHTFVSANISSGPHTFKVVVTDNAGATREATREVVIDHAPTLTLAAPATASMPNLLLTNNSLRVEGTFADEQPGTTLTVSLGNATILQTSAAGAFSVDHSLASVAPGEYTLAVRAVDSEGHHTVATRNVIVEPGQSGIEPIASEVQELLDTDQGAVLYKKRDGTVILRNASGVEATLQIPAGIGFPGRFDLQAGYVVTTWTDSPSSYESNLYLFDSTGRAVSVPSGEGASDPQLRYPWLIWSTNQVQLYNLVTQARTAVPFAGWPNPAFVTTPGAEQVLASVHTSGSGSGYVSDILRYDLTSGASERLTSGSAVHDLPATDNVRIAWRRTSISALTSSLFVAPVANPTAATQISQSISAFTLRDGLLAWTEPNADGTAVLKVDDGTTTTVAASYATSAPFVADGRVTFQENGKVYVWKSGTGKQVLLNTIPTQALRHDDAIGFFTKGDATSQTLYRVPLP